MGCPGSVVVRGRVVVDEVISSMCREARGLTCSRSAARHPHFKLALFLHVSDHGAQLLCGCNRRKLINVKQLAHFPRTAWPAHRVLPKRIANVLDL